MATAIPQSGSAAIPEAAHLTPPSPIPVMEDALNTLEANKDTWVATSISERISLLNALIPCIDAVSERWVSAALDAKKITPGTPAEGEEWLGGPFTTLRNIRLLIRALQETGKHGAPQVPGKVRVTDRGTTVAPVFPTDIWDKIFYGGITGEIWMEEGVTPANLSSHQAAIYREKAEEGKVALVLGAGNVASIGPMDALYKLFVEDQVVILKMNPVNAYLGAFIEEGFAPLFDAGFMRIVYGGAKEGSYLCTHAKVHEIHITGSDKTHDAIVFGVGQEGAEHKSRGERLNPRRITSELGNVSPVIVVPGPWSHKDLQTQAANIASMLTNNGGFNCNALRVIVQHETWEHREPLLEGVRDVFAQIPPRNAYYPGAQERFQQFINAHPDAERIGPSDETRVPWTIISGLSAENTEEICFNTESFCAVTSEVGLEANDPAEFIRKAVKFCNDTLWGTLSASILIHPKSLKDPAVREAYEEALADLRYGAIVVNDWGGLAYGVCSTTWGAYPGHPIDDIQSGRGVVHNTYLFDKPLKSILYCPFRPFPRPTWSVLNRMTHVIAKRATAWEAGPGLLKALKIIAAAIRG